ncbi:hypothetical protein D3C76_1289440 [compost metagenome]
MAEHDEVQQDRGDADEEVLLADHPLQEFGGVGQSGLQQMVAHQHPGNGEDEVDEADAQGAQTWVHWGAGGEIFTKEYIGRPDLAIRIKKTGWFSLDCQ